MMKQSRWTLQELFVIPACKLNYTESAESVKMMKMIKKIVFLNDNNHNIILLAISLANYLFTTPNGLKHNGMMSKVTYQPSILLIS